MTRRASGEQQAHTAKGRHDASGPATASQLGRIRNSLTAFGPVTVNLIAISLLLGTLAIVTARALGPTDRGVVVVFMTLTSVLIVAGSLGTNTFARVHLVSADSEIELADYIGITIVLSLAQLFIAFGIGWAALVATHSFGNGAVLVFLVAYSFLSISSYMLRDGLYAFGHSTRASRADAIGAAAQLVLVVAAWGLFGLTLDRTLAAITCGQSVELIYLTAQFRRRGLSLRPRHSRGKAWLQIRGGLPAVLTDLGRSFIFRLDRLLLGVFASTALVGVYSVGVTMTEALLIIPIGIGQVIFHRVASGRRSIDSLGRLRTGAVALSMVIGGLLFLASPWLIKFLFGEEYRAAVTPLRILVIGAVAMGSYVVDVACINAAGKLQSASLLTLFGFAVVIVLDIALIPAFGMTGAAEASTIAYIAMAVATIVRLRSVARSENREMDDVPPGPDSGAILE